MDVNVPERDIGASRVEAVGRLKILDAGELSGCEMTRAWGRYHTSRYQIVTFGKTHPFYIIMIML